MDPGQFYHVFNQANGTENLFIEEINYSFFLKKLKKHILPVCRMYAYSLVPNHFHLLVQVRLNEELELHWTEAGQTIPLTDKMIGLKVSKAFSNFFSSYSQSFNKVYNRKGSLFIPSMKTEQIYGIDCLRDIMHYIHTNPVQHRVVNKIEDWPHSSYHLFLERGETIVERKQVLKIFGGLEKFIDYHKRSVSSENKWLECI